MRYIYSTRETYPTHRVDVSHLFSHELVAGGHSIDWHMQSAEPSPAGRCILNDKENVILGKAVGNQGPLGKLINVLLGLFHDLMLWRHVDKTKHDFVQVRDKSFAALIGLLAAKRNGKPFYYWMSFPLVEADNYRARDSLLKFSLLKRFYYRVRGAIGDFFLYQLILPYTDHVFVQSDAMLESVAQRGIPREAMTAVPMGVNFADFSAQGKQQANLVDLDAPVLLYVGTLVRMRQLDVLIKMLPLVHKEFPGAVLLMVGDAPASDLQLLRDEVDALGLADSVVFTGFLTTTEVREQLRNAAVCYSPIPRNPILDVGSPTKIIEYIACKKPLVANHHPDQSDIMQRSGLGSTCELTPEAFAQETLTILNDYNGYEARLSCAFEYVKETRSYSSIGEHLIHKYETLLGTKSNGN